MAEISKELLAKLMKAANQEEAAELLKAEGQGDAPMDVVWRQLEALRAKEAQELSLDELSDVAGGRTERDWWKDGCAATVEPGSDCWATDGGCHASNIKYHNLPSRDESCTKCGRSWCVRGLDYGGKECKYCGIICDPWGIYS